MSIEKVILVTDEVIDEQAIYVEGILVATSRDISQSFFYASQLAEWLQGKTVEIAEVQVDINADGDGTSEWPETIADLEVYMIPREYNQ